MKPSQIIIADAQKHGIEPNQALSMVKQMVDKGSLTVQKNDSLLIITPIEPHQVEVHLMTNDKPMILVKSLMQYLVDFKKNNDIQVVYGKADNPQITKLMTLSGWPVEASDNPKYNWMAKI